MVSGITATVLSVGCLGMGIGMNIKHNDPSIVWEHEAAPWKAASITGYILAGAFAALSGVSWFMYYRSGKSSAAKLSFMPTDNGFFLTGSFSF